MRFERMDLQLHAYLPGWKKTWLTVTPLAATLVHIILPPLKRLFAILPVVYKMMTQVVKIWVPHKSSGFGFDRYFID